MRATRILALVSISALTMGVSVQPSGAKVPKCFGKPATIVGTPNNDGIDRLGKNKKKGVLRGTQHSDVIVGLGGMDRIKGNGGNDLICGGEGFDTLSGNKGRDRISSGPGGSSLIIDEESMNGGRGGDRLQGEPGWSNDIYGGRGADVIRSRGVGEVACGDELCTERLSGGPGADRILGGSSDAGSGRGLLRGGVGSDLLRGSTGDDVLFGGDGDDFLDGSDGDNSNDGGDGTDECINPSTAEGAENCEG